MFPCSDIYLIGNNIYVYVVSHKERKDEFNAVSFFGQAQFKLLRVAMIMTLKTKQTQRLKRKTTGNRH